MHFSCFFVSRYDYTYADIQFCSLCLLCVCVTSVCVRKLNLKAALEDLQLSLHLAYMMSVCE